MVTIPDDVAKEAAVWHRTQAASVPTFDDAEWHRNLADLLDPQPPSLREQVADVLRGTNDSRTYAQDADDVLAVVADWLAAQPMPYPDVVTRGQRDHDVRLLRGGSDV